MTNYNYISMYAAVPTLYASTDENSVFRISPLKIKAAM
jgi:hypothetical protein